MVLVLLWGIWILSGGLESVFDWIIEVMHEEMANVIRFPKQPISWRFTVKLRNVQCSCIAGVAALINEIWKKSFWRTLLDTLFNVDP